MPVAVIVPLLSTATSPPLDTASTPKLYLASTVMSPEFDTTVSPRLETACTPKPYFEVLATSIEPLLSTDAPAAPLTSMPNAVPAPTVMSPLLVTLALPFCDEATAP